MGRIKTTLIKRTTEKLMEEYGDMFTTDFEKNKKIVEKLTDVDKKKRNQIAGYATKLKKINLKNSVEVKNG